MAKRRSTPRRSSRTVTSSTAQGSAARRAGRRTAGGKPGKDGWPTAITRIDPNRILLRGYMIDELMGRVTFGEAIYLAFTGELPTRDVGRIVEALLVSEIDHGATPPSTMAARIVATTGAPIRAAAAAGVLAFGSPLGGGGSIDLCFKFLDEGLALVGEWVSFDDAARRMVDRLHATGEVPPGFGHRFHTRDPRAARIMQMALELELEGRYVQFARSVERVLSERGAQSQDSAVHINVDGAIAAVCGDLGLDAETGNMLFMVSRLPGIVAHAAEEQRRQAPMRHIDAGRPYYDGPEERRLPVPRR